MSSLVIQKVKNDVNKKCEKMLFKFKLHMKTKCKKKFETINVDTCRIELITLCFSIVIIIIILYSMELFLLLFL